MSLAGYCPGGACFDPDTKAITIVQSSQPATLRRNAREYIRRKTTNDATDTVIQFVVIRSDPRLSFGGNGADMVQQDSKADGEQRRGW